jgi:plastocyanin
MRRRGVVAVVFAAAIAAVSCGGGGGGGGNPAAPTPTGSGGSTTPVTITIQGINGKQSFSPNPASIPAGSPVVFKNNDTVTHHIQLDDQSMQTADIPAGGTSAALPLGAVSKAYHCTLHPTMVGSLNSAETPDPPACTFNYC